MDLTTITRIVEQDIQMDTEALSKQASQVRILVVDDEPRIRNACRQILLEQGFEVALAPDGKEGLRMIRREHYDIILVDLMMPVLSGFEVLSQVKKNHPDTVIIVITGYATVEHSITAMKQGAFDFIPKPFTPDQLRVIVAKAIQYNRALQDIAETNTRLKVMVNRLTDGVLATDSEKRVVLANPAFLHMTGYHGQYVIGRRIDDIQVGTQLRDMIDRALAMAGDTVGEITEEITFGDDQNIKHYKAKSSPFPGRSGFNIGTITVLNDITAQKEIEQMKSDFVSMVSHEVRSPMNSLLMQLKVILDGLAGDVSAKQREILERSSGKILALSNMVSELLDLARIESGLVTSEKTMIDVGRLLNDQVTFHTPGAREKDITIELVADETLPPLLANQQSMDEVMTNLITNAIKYSPEKSSITVSAEVSNEYLSLSVRDNGFGIPPEDMDNIFNRFYRVKDNNTRTIHGTGLGLAIVKNIVEAHHGSLNVSSTPRTGSTFTVLLPLTDT